MAQWTLFAVWAGLAIVSFAVGATAKATGHPNCRFIAGAAWVCFFLTIVFAATAREGMSNPVAGMAVALVYAGLFVWAIAGGKSDTSGGRRPPKGYTGGKVISMPEDRPKKS